MSRVLVARSYLSDPVHTITQHTRGNGRHSLNIILYISVWKIPYDSWWKNSYVSLWKISMFPCAKLPRFLVKISNVSSWKIPTFHFEKFLCFLAKSLTFLCEISFFIRVRAILLRETMIIWTIHVQYSSCINWLQQNSCTILKHENHQ